MKRLQISTPNFVIKIRNFNTFTMTVLFFSAILQGKSTSDQGGCSHGRQETHSTPIQVK